MNHETLLYPQKQFGIFLLAILIGVIGGIAAWLFRLLIGFIHNFAFFGSLTAVYDANQHTLPSSWGWLIIFVPILGGMVVVWLVKNFAPEAKGHGVPEVIHAIHYNQGIIKGRVSLVKALASAITIGTGGSLGREGPIVQIGSAFSSAIGQWFGLSASQKIVLISCGASAGIAATFNAPLAGVLFSIELLLVTTNSKTLLPVAVSTVIAANVGHYLIGTDPAFTISIPEIHHSVSQ
ncbi:MAG: chloride channel protein, partial [Sedimenticola sp.]|nr:chloride channel protein [Sedimenticola sp.]